jgi:hypothetical protein
MTTQSTPTIPEDFGNPWMANLQEIGLPEPVAWTPQAPGWYVLAALLLSAILWGTWRLYRRWRADAYRRTALGELQELERLAADASRRAEAVAALPVLLKRTALAAYPRAEVAQLSGAAWLGFLDGTLGSNEFSQGPGKLLPEISYQGPVALRATEEGEVRNLLALARRWVHRHRAREDR